MLEFDRNCTLLLTMEGTASPTAAGKLQKGLESQNENEKLESLQETIMWMVQGESYPQLLMTMIRYVVPSNNHRIKKLLMIYWEIVDKCKADGTPRDEMILVCNALLNDLSHPNEYIRGCTLRLLCKMKYYKIIEPLLDAITNNLNHRYSYVRRNAVMCVYSLVHTFGVDILPNAIDDVDKLLYMENDLATKRNCFIMLMHCDISRATSYLLSIEDEIHTMGDIFQLAVMELVKKLTHIDIEYRELGIRIICQLLDNCSTAVMFDGAATIVSMTKRSAALSCACRSYVTLLTTHSDINVKLIILNRINSIMNISHNVMQPYVIDIMRALKSSSIEVRRETLDTVIKLTTKRNAIDVTNQLKKEFVKTNDSESQRATNNKEYRQLLVKSLRSVCSQYPESAMNAVGMFMDCLAESDKVICVDVVLFIRHLVVTYPCHRFVLLSKLINSLWEIRDNRVLRTAIWLCGQYTNEWELSHDSIQILYNALLPLPILPAEMLGESIDNTVESICKHSSAETSVNAAKIITRTVVLEDGTYGTEDIMETHDKGHMDEGNVSSRVTTLLRKLIVDGDLYLATVVTVCLTKLIFRAEKNGNLVPREIFLKVIYGVCNLVRLCRDNPLGISESDAYIRTSQCLKCLINMMKGRQNQSAFFFIDDECINEVILKDYRNCSHLVQRYKDLSQGGPQHNIPDPSNTIEFRQLGGSEDAGDIDILSDDNDLRLAETGEENNNSMRFYDEKMMNIEQLTGLADALYVEADIRMQEFDLQLYLYVVNRTEESLRNINIELSTHGDLRLVDKPPVISLEPHEDATCRASIKVQSTETGVIFGHIHYEGKGSGNKRYLVLNEIHVDFRDYLERCYIDEVVFRRKWTEFEWENKVNINTAHTNVYDFLEHLIKKTNMTLVGNYPKVPSVSKIQRCVKGDNYLEALRHSESLKKLTENSAFCAVNLYSRSIFGEDALLNLSIEKLEDMKLSGSMRIRSRIQGIALSLGDVMSALQREIVV